jgi:ribosome-binding factor A
MGQRAKQVAEELRNIVSRILIEDVSDPSLGFVTVTRVEVTDDLRFGRIFYSVLGDETQKVLTEYALTENLGHIKRLAIQRINLKFAMEMRFEFDPSINDSFRIDDILKKIKEEGHSGQ